jgi:hypothetical protein
VDFPVSELDAAFSALRPNAKAMFLAQVAHMATVAARDSYVTTDAHPERNYEHPDAIILRDANNFVHRVTGYISHVLDGTEGEGQDASVMSMIAEHFHKHQLAHYLPKWLGISN